MYGEYSCHAFVWALRIIALCALATGCSVTRPIYPIAWPAQVTVDSGECPAIDGHYQNASEMITYDGRTYYIVSLAHKLNGGIGGGAHEDDDRLGLTHHDAAEDVYETIRLRLVTKTLHVEASRGDGSTRAFELSIRKPCRDSLLILEEKTDVAPYLIANIVSRYTLGLGRAEDGSLLVLDRNYGVGTYLILPVAGSAAWWMRFRPVEPSAGQVPESTP